MNKKVVFVTIAMGGGGTERAVSLLANKFADKGLDVSILMIAGGDVAYELNPKIEIKQVGDSSGGSLKKRIERILKMRKFFKSKRKANIIAMGSVASIFSLIANLGLRNNVIISERNKPDRLNGKSYSKKMRFVRDILYKQANWGVFQTYDARDYFTKFPKKKACVIPNSISPTIPVAYKGERDNEVVTAGRLIPEKNHKLLISGFAEFVKSHNEYKLKIYGNGELEDELKDYAVKCDVASSVEFIPFSNTLFADIAKSGIYVSSSDGEGISNSILEAMALGIPTIATDCPIGGSKMCIEDGVNGILIPVGGKEELVNALSKIAGDKEYAKLISENAIKVRETFSEERIIEMWEKLLV